MNLKALLSLDVPTHLPRKFAPLAMVLVLFTSSCAAGAGRTDQPQVQSETVSATAGPAGVRADSETTTEAQHDTDVETGAETGSSTCSFTSSVDQLSTRVKAAQLLTVGVQSFDEAHRAVETYRVGGILLDDHFREDLVANGGLTAVRSMSDKPLMVAVTPQIGDSELIHDLVGPMPSVREALLGTYSEAETLGREVGEQLSALGVTTFFGPGLNALSEFAPRERAMQTARSYGLGLLDAGVTPVVRHSPEVPTSEGDAPLDSPNDPATSPVTDTSSSNNLIDVPGTATLMGHAELPGLTEPGLLASVSPAAYESLRSGRYGGAPYDGVIFTDDLTRHEAHTEQGEMSEAVLAALRAGADAPVWGGTDGIDETLDAIEAAIQDGTYSEEQLNASFMRSLEFRRKDNCGF